MEHVPIITGSATIEPRLPGIVVMRYRPGVLVNAAAIAENVQAMRPLEDNPGLLIHIPEGVDFAMDMLDRDHSSLFVMVPETRMLVMVVEDPVFRHASELYFAYHPQPHPVRFFDAVEDGLRWLDAELADRSR